MSRRNQGLRHYGVWKGTISRYDPWDSRTDEESPHAHLIFKDDSGDDIEVSINVKSSADSGLTSIVYWKFRDPDFFTNSSVITKLKALTESRFYDAKEDNGPRIDLLRDGFIDLKKGQIPPWNTAGVPDDDVVDFLESVSKHAVAEKATIYVFGQSYQPRNGVLDKKGIHQVHMNQGNFLVPRHTNWYEENGPHQDGGLFFRFPDGRWEAFFIAFASQAWQTDDVTGKPTGGNLQGYLQGVVDPPVEDPVDQPGTTPVPKVNIHSALVNPAGPDNNPVLEEVKVENDGPDDVDLTGWAIENQSGGTQGLTAGTKVTAAGGQVTVAAGACYLPNNRDGKIILKDNEGRVVDIAQYTKSEVREGVWVRFQ